MQEIFEENASDSFKGAIIWTPMLEPDVLHAAVEREAGFSDTRLAHFWDPDRILGRFLSRTLGLKTAIAWDVYLVYPPSHPWHTAIPPAPAFWMHQLDEEPPPFLDPPRLKHAVRAMITRTEHE